MSEKSSMSFKGASHPRDMWGVAHSDPKWRHSGTPGVLVRTQGNEHPIQRGENNRWESVSFKQPAKVAEVASTTEVCA